MKLNFFNDEWEALIGNCGFTDVEMEIIPFLRRGWYSVDIAAELNISVSTFKRRKKRIEAKLIRYIERAGL
jgi:DNA-binding NarL/FixJ family response regulator